MILTRALETYLERLDLKGHSKATIKNNRFHLNAFNKWLWSTYELSESKFLRRFHLLRFQGFLGHENDYKPSYINQKTMAVNGFMAFLRKEGEVINEVLEVLEWVKEPIRLPKVIELDEYDQLLSSIQLKDKYAFRDYTIIVLFMSSGIRVGGLQKLNIKDVNLEERTLKVNGKGDKERLTVFGEQCREVLRVYLKSIRPAWKGAQESDALFLSKKTGRLTICAIQGMVKKLAKKAGIESHLSPHTFRRTFCTELIKADGNLYHIAQMMGHESLEHLKCYARLNIKPLKDTHERCHPRG